MLGPEKVIVKSLKHLPKGSSLNHRYASLPRGYDSVKVVTSSLLESVRGTTSIFEDKIDVDFSALLEVNWKAYRTRVKLPEPCYEAQRQLMVEIRFQNECFATTKH